MSGAKSVAFGKKNVALTRSPLPKPTRKVRWMIWGLAGAFAVVVMAGGLSIYSTLSPSPKLTTTGAEVRATPTPFALNGIWAANGQACAGARLKLEFDGRMMTSISMLGRVPIGPYTATGDNPIVFTFDNGQTVVWDATNENRLDPISVTPDKAGRQEMLTLMRC